MSNTPNTTIIEISAVGKIKDALFRTEHVEPDICDNDKTPSWDGELRVYHEKIFAKKFLYGRIPVQIKGQWVSKLQGNIAKFSVDIADLHNYLNDNGVIFFLVHMKSFDQYKIYYSALLPFDLRRILDDAQGKKSKQITLQKFPHRHPNKMLQILFNFLLNKSKQGQLLPNIRSLQDLRATNLEIENFEFGISSIGITSKDELLDTLLGSPLYVYAKPSKISASFVVDKIVPKEISFSNNVPIFANGELLYDCFSVVKTLGKKEEIRIGPGISMELGDKTLHMNYIFDGTLRDQIAELKLLAAMMQGQPVQIGNYITEGENLSFTGHTIEEVLARLEYLQKISNTLSALHIKKDLNLSSLSEHDYKMLQRFIFGMNGNPVPFSINDNPGVGVLTIGNIKVLLSCKRNDVGNNFLISDFFTSSGWRLTGVGEPIEKGVPMSPYILMDCDALKSIDNICLGNAVGSICSYPFSAPYGTKITLFILELLKFYDTENYNESIVLDVANELLDFLSAYDKNNQLLHQINKIQIIKRQRPLSNKELYALVSIKESDTSPQFKLAANILLESFHEANLIYQKLSVSEQQIFDAYPVTRFWSGHHSSIANNHE